MDFGLSNIKRELLRQELECFQIETGVIFPMIKGSKVTEG